MLDHKMDPDLLFDVREFLVTTLEEEKLSDHTKAIRLDLIRRLTTAQNFLAKPYQDMKPSPKKDKSSADLILHHSLHHLSSLHHLDENQYENESCTSSGGSTSGAGSTIECYEEIDHPTLAHNARNMYENVKVLPSASTLSNGQSVLSTSQYNEITARLSNNALSAQYENTKHMVNMGNTNGGSNIMNTKHGQVEIVNAFNGVKDADCVDGEGKTNVSSGGRKASNGSVKSMHDIKFSGILPAGDAKALAENELIKHKSLIGSVSYPSTASLSTSTKNLSSMNSNNVEILSISASALKYSAARCGNLLKKEKILFVDHFKKYWVALVNGYLYLYNNDKDSKACSVINVEGDREDGGSVYTARPSMSKEKEHLFEIVAPGQKTHYFAANCSADLDLWISAINQCGQNNNNTKSSPTPSTNSTPSGNNFSAPSGGLRQSPPGSRPGSDTSRELPSLPVQTAPDSCEQYYDEPDALIRPVLHNYEHMVNQDSLYNEIDESESVSENYYNIASHPVPNPHTKTDSTSLPHRTLDLDADKWREECMLTYDQPTNNKCILEEEGTEEEKNCEETSELFQNNSQSNRIQHIIQRMEASMNTKDNAQTTPTLRRNKRPESQLIVSLSNQTYEPIQRKGVNRNSR
ncbi:hypothetical protein M8J76_005045 [Diaphorina citri]|nr:hypothetical protein M8J75_003191 [Diaphorina citri]KAI5713764.1 hypothetical protein M8J76_005045 [Diaphorina citri]